VARVEDKKISDLIPDSQNVNVHTQRGRGIVEHSVRKYGIGRGIVAAGKGTDTPQIIGGNLTHEIIGSLDMDDVIFVHTNGEKLIVTVRDDIAPNSAEAIALGIIDNESNKLSYSPDLDLLAQLAAADGGILAETRKQDKTFSDMLDGMKPYNVDFQAEWQGMPEFSSKDIEGAAFICIVRFTDENDIKKFEEILGWKLSHKGKTYSTWYPKKDFDQLGKGLEFSDEP